MQDRLVEPPAVLKINRLGPVGLERRVPKPGPATRLGARGRDLDARDVGALLHQFRQHRRRLGRALAHGPHGRPQLHAESLRISADRGLGLAHQGRQFGQREPVAVNVNEIALQGRHTPPGAADMLKRKALVFREFSERGGQLVGGCSEHGGKSL